MADLPRKRMRESSSGKSSRGPLVFNLTPLCAFSALVNEHGETIQTSDVTSPTQDADVDSEGGPGLVV